MEHVITINNLLIGFKVVLTPHGLFMVIIGVMLGILIGATPGMSPSMGVALLVPFSYGMDPRLAFFLFVAAYQAANYGGSITAVAINAPGTPSAVVTAIDGYKMTEKGKPGEALGTAVLASTIGGLIGTIILILFAIPLAKAGLKFGPAEYFALAVLGLTTVGALGGASWVKSFVGILIGLLLNTVGTDPFTGETRFTFGVLELFDGFSFIPSMIGLFALGEILLQLEKYRPMEEKKVKAFSSKLLKLKDLWGIKHIILKASALGTSIGIIPGAGATIAAFISYGEAKRSSKHPEKFGTGIIDGVAASEAANSSSVGGALVPLLSLGIPGSATDAVLLGALTLHGLVAGPELFTKHPDIVYGIFVCLFFANIFTLIFGLLGNKLWLKVIGIPKGILYTLIIAMCILGSYTIKNSLFDSWVCIGFGILGWILKRYGYQPAPVVLGLVLGTMLELNYRRAILMGGPTIFFTSPLSLILLIAAAFSFVAPIYRARKKRKVG